MVWEGKDPYSGSQLGTGFGKEIWGVWEGTGAKAGLGYGKNIGVFRGRVKYDG
jgi:hypothetical protein